MAIDGVGRFGEPGRVGGQPENLHSGEVSDAARGRAAQRFEKFRRDQNGNVMGGEIEDMRDLLGEQPGGKLAVKRESGGLFRTHKLGNGDRRGGPAAWTIPRSGRKNAPHEEAALGNPEEDPRAA